MEGIFPTTQTLQRQRRVLCQRRCANAGRGRPGGGGAQAGRDRPEKGKWLATETDGGAAGEPPTLDLSFGRFRERYNAFYEAWKWYDHIGIGSRLRQTKTYTDAKAALISASDDLIASLTGLQQLANYSGTEVVSFQPDIDTLTKVKE